LKLLWGEKACTAGEVASQIPAGVRRVLDAWAEPSVALGLRFCLSGNADHVVLGHVDDATLVEAARQLDATWDLLDPHLPKVVSHPSRPVLAVLFDQATALDETLWPALLAALAEKRALLPADVDRLRRNPAGVMVRGVPMLLQPTYDMAGNAAAGDDEFRLKNELIHKFAQCLLTERCGQMPKSLRWGIGHLAEVRLTKAVYQFDVSGFVAAGDHFDWARRAERLLEKRTSKRSYSLPEALLGGGPDGGTVDGDVVVWGALDALLALTPTEFSALLENLADLHTAQDPYGVADDYRGDPATSAQAVATRLEQLPTKALLEHLGSG